MYVPRGSVSEAPAENNQDDDVVIIRRGNRGGRSSAERATRRAEAAADNPEPQREGIGMRILKAPGRALGRFAGGVARHPIQSALSLLGIGATLAGAHHLGLTQQLASLAPAGGFRDTLNWPGAQSHRLATLGAERIGEQLPGVVTTPARAFLSATNGLFAPRP